jgi:hypothetical protein
VNKAIHKLQTDGMRLYCYKGGEMVLNVHYAVLFFRDSTLPP